MCKMCCKAKIRKIIKQYEPYDDNLGKTKIYTMKGNKILLIFIFLFFVFSAFAFS